MLSIYSFGANTLIANEEINLNPFLISISVHLFKGPRDNAGHVAVQTTTNGRSKVFVVPKQF